MRINIRQRFVLLSNLMKGYYTVLIIGICCLIGVSLLAMPIPTLTGNLVDQLTSNPSSSTLHKMITIIACLQILKAIMSLVGKLILSKYSIELSNRLRLQMIQKTMDFPMNFINKKEKGYLMSRISESSNVANIFSPSMINIVVGVFDFFISFFMIFKINVSLALLVVLMLPIYIMLSVYFSKKMKKTVNQVNEESAILSGGIFETINSLEEIKILDYRRKQMRMIYNLAYSVKQSVLNMNKSLNLYFENFSFMSAIIGTGILYLSGLLIIDQALSVGGYIAFTGYLARILGNIQVYSTAGITIQPILVSIQRIQEFLSFGDEKEGRDQSLTGRIDSIKFVNVTFKYEGQNEILQNFNYRVSKGDKVLIVGTNGSGKTTLIKLLLSLYNPTYGQIMFNDVDLSKIKLDEIRQRISVVSQNIHLFKGTIIDNIILEKDCSRLQYLDKVIKDYKLNTLFNLESKLNDEVENGGSNLSGGQKQLIAFLRAVVSQKEILILDEPTSALDAAAKERIINILKNECMSNIVIIISHDPSFSFIENKIHMSKISESSFAT